MRASDGVAGARAARVATYEALSRILDGDVDLLVETRADEDEEDLRSLARTLSVDPEPLVRDASADELRRSYDALFAIPGPRYVPPYASAHRGNSSTDGPASASAFASAGDGQLGGEPARRSHALYSRFGFRPDRGDGMPDHVAAQLEFAARLAATDDGRADAARSKVFDLGLFGWLERFERRVDRNDDLGVYAGVVSLARRFVAHERELVTATERESEAANTTP